MVCTHSPEVAVDRGTGTVPNLLVLNSATGGGGDTLEWAVFLGVLLPSGEASSASPSTSHLAQVQQIRNALDLLGQTLLRAGKCHLVC
jgi:hypothetical protein